MITALRKKINEAKARSSLIRDDLSIIDLSIMAAADKLRGVIEAQEVARKAATIVQDDLATKLSGIVTKAIQAVFADKTEFIAQFVERRGVAECDLFVKVDGKPRDILRGDGGGLADVCSLCLQLAYILISDVDRVLIADEACRHMNREAQERFAQVLRHLVDEFGFTMVLVTHAEPLSELADRLFRVTKPGAVSKVEVLR